jgi:2-polyprenyl-3-methyl-5-hydroxy-6-metoxy-1,4-benzoquinol methylase
MATSLDGIDLKLAQAKAQLVAGYSAGASNAAMVYLGDALGLYAAMRGAGPVTSAEFADRTSLHERWLREWLQQQAAAGILEYRGEGRFELLPETALVVADEANPFAMIGAIAGLSERMANLPRIAEAFRTGIGLTVDDRGPNAAIGVERQLAPWHRTVLVQTLLPALEGMVARLETGAAVADIGCGAGVALIEMAKAFPLSRFHGYDISRRSLARGEENVRAAGVGNVVFHDVAADPLPSSPTYDLICTFDCLHDMTNPDVVVAAIRRAARTEATWVIADINGAETFEENLKNRLAAAVYAASVQGCLASGLSEPGGAGLGALGLPEPRMRELTERNGFTRFRRLPIEHPVNAYYEARP